VIVTISMPLALPSRRREHSPVVVVMEQLDEALLGRVAERDEEAFAELYDRFSRAVYTLCVRTLGDRGRAEDAAQEAFASIWRSAGTFDRRRGSAAAWIFAVARNAATDSARRRVPTPVDSGPETADPAPLPDERAVASAEAFRVHAALGVLGDREREVIELAYFSGLSQSEIAERLKTPLGTVKTRTRSALRRLATELGGGAI
jgi:RNA polymerase sigma-70 factor (ECF subfamily)